MRKKKIKTLKLIYNPSFRLEPLKLIQFLLKFI